MDIKLTEHVRWRYPQRVLGIEKMANAKQYYYKNKRRVDQEILAIWEDSNIIMENVEYDSSGDIINDYYLSTDIILVVDPIRNCLVTMYQIGTSGGKKIKNPFALIEKIIQVREDMIIKQEERLQLVEDNKNEDIKIIDQEIQVIKKKFMIIFDNIKRFDEETAATVNARNEKERQRKFEEESKTFPFAALKAMLEEV